METKKRPVKRGELIELDRKEFIEWCKYNMGATIRVDVFRIISEPYYMVCVSKQDVDETMCKITC